MSNPTNGAQSHDGAKEIAAYARAQTPAFRDICEVLSSLIDKALPKAASKVWHGSPVWFIDENPVVGYSTTAKAVKLLFWNGRVFDRPEFKPVGKYGAAEVVFLSVDDLDEQTIRGWLQRAGANVFDSRAFWAKKRAERTQRR